MFCRHRTGSPIEWVLGKVLELGNVAVRTSGPSAPSAEKRRPPRSFASGSRGASKLHFTVIDSNLRYHFSKPAPFASSRQPGDPFSIQQSAFGIAPPLMNPLAISVYERGSAFPKTSGSPAQRLLPAAANKASSYQFLPIFPAPEFRPALSRTETPLSCSIRQNILQIFVDGVGARAKLRT